MGNNNTIDKTNHRILEFFGHDGRMNNDDRSQKNNSRGSKIANVTILYVQGGLVLAAVA